MHFDIQRETELFAGWDDEKFGSGKGLDYFVNKAQGIDVIIGGPPCQAYSIAGRVRDENGMRDDYRNYLFEHYLSVVNRYRPKVFVFENVPGILSAAPDGTPITDLIKQGFANIGYDIIEDLKITKVNASDYGVPQNRERMIIVGINNRKYKNAQRMLNMFYKEILPKYKVTKKITVKEAIGDLPACEPFYDEEHHKKRKSHDVLQLNSILGNEMLLPQRKFIENPLPMLQTTIAVKKSEQREILLGALTEISDGDPLLKYYVDTTTHEIILSFLGNVQMEVICAILEEKYHVEAEIKEPTVIYMERPLRKAEYTIHIEVPPNPFWASVGLSIEPLPIGSGVQYESRVSLGYLNQSFQNAVMEGVLYGCEQGLYGWKVTDCKICFEYGLYYSPVSTPADFRLLSPIVLEQALKKAGTELLEPYLHFEIYAPQEYLSRAYHDAPRYCADIVSTQVKNDEVILKGEIPARCIQEYRNDLTYFTNGQGVCLTELKGYQPAIGKFICQPRRPNSRIDKVRHMFHKLA
nr:DNA cytosine methyltransferase [Dorea longicatena]